MTNRILSVGIVFGTLDMLYIRALYWCDFVFLKGPYKTSGCAPIPDSRAKRISGQNHRAISIPEQIFCP